MGASRPLDRGAEQKTTTEQTNETLYDVLELSYRLKSEESPLATL
jgi:hypothetical protein